MGSIGNDLRSAVPGGLKQALGGLICHPVIGAGLARLFGDRIPARGMRVHTDNPRVANETKAALFWGIYERAEIDFVRRHLDGDLDVVELGGSIGVLSCAILRGMVDSAKLVTVEADPALTGLLEQNLASNHPGRRYSVLQQAVSYTAAPGSTVDYSVGERNVSGHVVGSGDAERGTLRSVPATTLSRILAEHEVEDYALVADIEGAEVQILLHDVASLARCREILIELHQTEVDGTLFTVEDLVDRIEGLGFRLVDRYGTVCAFRR
jgi:FkbM family methyltransferase